MNRIGRLSIALLAAGLLQAGAFADGSSGKTVKLNNGGSSLAAANGTFAATATYSGYSAKLALTADINALALRKELHAVHIGASMSSAYKKKPAISAGAIVANTRVLSKTSSAGFLLSFRSATALSKIGRSHMVGTIPVELYAIAHCHGQAHAYLAASGSGANVNLDNMSTSLWIEYSCSAGAGFGPDKAASDASKVMDAALTNYDNLGNGSYHSVYWDGRGGFHAGDGIYLRLFDCSSDLELFAAKDNKSYADALAKWSVRGKQITLLSPRKW